MTARPVRPRSAASARRFAALGISLAAIVLGGMAALYFLSLPPDLEERSLCRADVPLQHHTVVLVDTTDAFSKTQAARLVGVIAEERNALPRHARLTLLLLSAERPHEPDEVLSLCNPGRSANPLYQNEHQITARWKDAFGAPVDAAVARLIVAPTAPRSPIVQAITAVTWRLDFDRRVPYRTLVLVSDLLQHDPGLFTHYQDGVSYDAFLRSPLAPQATADLADVAVRLEYLRRPRDARFQNPAHRQFWQRYLQANGATAITWRGEAPPTPNTQLATQPPPVR